MNELAPRPAQFRPYGLVSLLDMLELYARQFVQAVQGLQTVQTLVNDRRNRGELEQLEVPVAGSAYPPILEALKQFQSCCVGIGARVASQLVDDLNKRLESKTLKWSELSRGLGEIKKIWMIECEDSKLLALDPLKADFFTRGHPGLKASVFDVFPDSAADFDEAGKCFALGRYTACVFHLMRVWKFRCRDLRRKFCLMIPSRTGTPFFARSTRS